MDAVDTPAYYESLQCNQTKFLPVAGINWATTGIGRSGIIPIHNDGTHKWIGLGISKFSANIMTIGGRYEPADYDLLTTAAREYNEEVGFNLPNLREEDVFGCYAVQSKYSMGIFYPLDRLPNHDFVPTDELYDIIWVTPDQLRIMASNQKFILRRRRSKKSHRYRSTTRAFLFSNDLKLLALTIASIVEHLDPFSSVNLDASLHRRPRLSFESNPTLCMDTESFLQDCQITPNWGNVGLIITPIDVAIMRGDRSIYILPIDDLDLVVDGLNRLNLKINVSLTDDHQLLVDLVPNLKLKVVNSIEYGLSRYDSSGTMLGTFMQSLFSIRTMYMDRVHQMVMELNLILDQEIKIFNLIRENGIFFNRKRALFLKGITRVNRILASDLSGLSYMQLKTYLSNCTPSNNYTVINIMLITQMIHQSDARSKIFI